MCRATRRDGRRRDDGSEVVEFTLVSILVVFAVAALLQLAFALHVRNTLISCAAEGARLASAEDRSAEDGERRTEELAQAALGDHAFVVTSTEVEIEGARAIEISVTAPVPVVGLWGIGSMTVEAHALIEVDRG